MANEGHENPDENLRPEAESARGGRGLGSTAGSSSAGGVAGTPDTAFPAGDGRLGETRHGMGSSGMGQVDAGRVHGGASQEVHQAADDDDWDEEPGLADTVDATSTVDELVVYLDGYLDAEQRRRVEQRLLEDEEARADLAALQNSWDALDCLPATPCSADFTESTMKLVVQNELAAAKSVNKLARKTLVWLAIAAAAVVSMGTGFWVTQSWQTAEERQFLGDLPLIRDWEKYQLIGDFEFLLDLEKEGLFAQEVNHEDR